MRTSGVAIAAVVCVVNYGRQELRLSSHHPPDYTTLDEIYIYCYRDSWRTPRRWTCQARDQLLHQTKEIYNATKGGLDRFKIAPKPLLVSRSYLSERHLLRKL